MGAATQLENEKTRFSDQVPEPNLPPLLVCSAHQAVARRVLVVEWSGLGPLVQYPYKLLVMGEHHQPWRREIGNIS